MNVKNLATRSSVALACAIAFHPAVAQSPSHPERLNLSIASSSQKDMWHVVLLVSAAVAVVGLIDDDSSLVVLGGAGVLLSLYEAGAPKFRFQSFRPGIDLMRMGPMSLGVNPFGFVGISQSFANPAPSAYLQLRFKF